MVSRCDCDRCRAFAQATFTQPELFESPAPEPRRLPQGTAEATAPAPTYRQPALW
jgi:hypothetical protein